MKSIQEKRLDQELQSIEKINSSILTKIIKIQKDEYNINLTILPNLLTSTDITIGIEFLLNIQHNFPFNPPRLYCLTPFSFPSFSDGRDMLEGVLNNTWTNRITLIEIINLIPKFIINYIESLKKNEINLIGNYYLDAKYDLGLLESLPVYFEKVKEKIQMAGKELEITRYIMISDIFFLLFDNNNIIDIWNRNTVKLAFWANLKALKTIKKIVNGDACELIWRSKKDNNYYMKLKTERTQFITELIMKNLKHFGINYTITKTILGPKTGVIPAIDIEMVEKQVIEIEEKIVSDKSSEQLLFLMTLYEKAIEYYSATNNPRYQLFTKKIQEIMVQPEYNQLLEVKDKAKKDDDSLKNKTNDQYGDTTGIINDSKQQKQDVFEKIKDDKESSVFMKKSKTPIPTKHNQFETETLLSNDNLQLNIVNETAETKPKESLPISTPTVKVSVTKENLNFDFDDDDEDN